jgi:2-succinyl-5-enolpyruvyl-6-hydroxy-3-cyclohexene-1-carboxylate synthase
MRCKCRAIDDAHLLGEWARLIFGTLYSAGISDLFISPGSRSTPFTWYALRTRGLGCHAIVDERSAAFAALGFARATGRPAALLCTSGSAPAHYFPALVEAALAFLPILVITADRPFETQHGGAAQSIDQTKLFGDHVRRYFELGLPDAAPSALIGLRRAVAQAVAISQGAVPGPVHLNTRARKPLEPRIAAGAEEAALTANVSALLAEPLTRDVASLAVPDLATTHEIAQALVAARAGAIVLGPLPPARKAIAEPLGELAVALGFAILAEASSQVRFPLGEHALACPEFGWLLSSERSRRRHAPDLLLCLGAAPTSAGFEPWALESGAARYVLAEHGSPDPLGGARVIARGDLAAWLEALRREIASIRHRPDTAQRAFTSALLESGRICRELISEEAASEPGLAEGAAVACIARALPRGAQWMLGNSLPIRDVDAYVTGTLDVVILSQRGANGIDGLISGAAGSALATGLPTLLLLGDVSLLHDLGGLAVARLPRTPLVVAVLDNAGGRIFDQLPVRDLYEDDPGLAQFWLTAPGCDLRYAARLFGLRYSSPTSDAELSTATREALQMNSATLLHVRVGPESARTVRERVLARLAASYANSYADSDA